MIMQSQEKNYTLFEVSKFYIIEEIYTKKWDSIISMKTEMPSWSMSPKKR